MAAGHNAAMVGSREVESELASLLLFIQWRTQDFWIEPLMCRAGLLTSASLT